MTGSDPDPHGLFAAEGDDPRYAYVQERPVFQRLMSEEWSQFSDLADPDCKAELARDFESRAWEIRVGALLRRIHGHDAVSSKPKGLDFRVDTSPVVWIECVAPTPGEGVASVRPVPTIHADWLDVDGVMLRYSSAIADKRNNQIDRDRKNGTIGPSDAVVIALSAAKIEVAGYEPEAELWPSEPPWIFRLLYGYGEEKWQSRSEGTRTFFPRDPTTPKPPRDRGLESKRIPTAYFAMPECAELSAVLFTASDTQTRKWGARGTDDLMLFHNPLATTPLPRGRLNGGLEFWVDEPDENGRRLIRRTDWRDPDERA